MVDLVRLDQARHQTTSCSIRGRGIQAGGTGSMARRSIGRG